ncbi:DNA-binding transcriptional LysR family regulator [Bosea sp. BE125]|uniref:LysR family transcriptional regulator n=1 Tax=Bosea sp. BE125 TaxID=2817909 RepID=UPI002857EC19|nr:LysR family transcriptional regulator [Bosea sp. BE125]MDR6873959.1 DNA-binding transcriptional LysR family regulator [Bosea sp. BE125]
MSRSALSDFEAVIALARHGRFRAAATELGMSPSALSHAISAVEARLALRLFNRTTRSVSLTAAGEQLVNRISPALAEIRDAVDAANSHRETPIGTLRLNSSVGAARQIMQPIVFEYLRRYPQMKIDLVTEDKLIDIVVDGFDAGIRLVETLPRDMIAVPLGPEQRMVVVASPAYLAENPPPRSPADLLAHRCIRSRMGSGAIWRWEFERRGERVVVDVQGPLTLDETGLMLEAARAGFGLSYLGEWSVAADLASGRLLRVLDDWTPPFPGLCLYYPGRRHVPAGLRALIDLIKERRAHPPG